MNELITCVSVWCTISMIHAEGTRKTVEICDFFLLHTVTAVEHITCQLVMRTWLVVVVD